MRTERRGRPGLPTWKAESRGGSCSDGPLARCLPTVHQALACRVCASVPAGLKECSGHSNNAPSTHRGVLLRHGCSLKTKPWGQRESLPRAKPRRLCLGVRAMIHLRILAWRIIPEYCRRRITGDVKNEIITPAEKLAKKEYK